MLDPDVGLMSVRNAHISLTIATFFLKKAFDEHFMFKDKSFNIRMQLCKFASPYAYELHL